MSLTQPRLIKVFFFGTNEWNACGKAVEEIKKAFSLEPRDKDPTILLQDFVGATRRVAPSQAVTTGNDLQDTPCAFASEMHEVKVRYYPKDGDKQIGPGLKPAPTNGIFVLTATMNSESEDVIQGWQELEKQFPAKLLPMSLFDPVTIYYAISDKEVTGKEVTYLTQNLYKEIPLINLQKSLRAANLLHGSFFQAGTHESYFLFSSKEKELEAGHFAMVSLPLLNLYFYSGNLRTLDKEGNLATIRGHMKEVQETIANKLNEYSSKGFGSITTEAERMDIFGLSKDLFKLRNDVSRVDKLIESVNTALSNFQGLKERLLADNRTEEIFCQKERLLESQKAQLQADAAYLQNTFESGRVVLDSIEDHMQLEYTRELQESNKKALSLQSAAFLIEFAIVFYYFLGSWHYILGENFYKFPPYARLGCAFIISSVLASGTHLFARWRLTKKNLYFYWLIGLLFPLVFTIAFITIFSLMH